MFEEQFISVGVV